MAFERLEEKKLRRQEAISLMESLLRNYISDKAAPCADVLNKLGIKTKQWEWLEITAQDAKELLSNSYSFSDYHLEQLLDKFAPEFKHKIVCNVKSPSAEDYYNK